MSFDQELLTCMDTQQAKHIHQGVRERPESASSVIQGCWKGGERARKINLTYFKTLPTAMYTSVNISITDLCLSCLSFWHIIMIVCIFSTVWNLVAADCPLSCFLKYFLVFPSLSLNGASSSPLCLFHLNVLPLNVIIDFYSFCNLVALTSSLWFLTIKHVFTSVITLHLKKGK